MELSIRAIEISPTPALAGHVQDRLEAALNQYGQRVGRVVVQLRDINGPRGGADKCCQLKVDLPGAGSVLVKQTGEDLYAAVSHAADRVKVAVGRKLSRRRGD